MCSVLKVKLVSHSFPQFCPKILKCSAATPDQVKFFRLKDVLEDMLRKFDHLNLVLASTEDKDAAQLLRGIRTTMAKHTKTVLYALDYTSDVSSQIPELLDLVETDPTGKFTSDSMVYTARWAGSTANYFETGDKGVTQLSTEIITMAERVASLFRDRKPGMPRDMGYGIPIVLIQCFQT